MTGRHLAADEAFFAEWAARRPGARRSLDRAARVGALLGEVPPQVPVLGVVGSKGKGTAAVHAAATLGSAVDRAGRVPCGLVTSPGLRTNRERVRLDGAALTPAGYEELADEVRAARAAVPRVGDGYLSPAGAYTMAGTGWLARHGARALVVEEGLGGRTDELSLLDPHVLLVTAVFREHADLLGGTVDEIAADLAGAAGPRTALVVTVPQAPEVMAVLAAAARDLAVPLEVTPAAPVRGVRDDLPPLVRAAAGAGVGAARSMCTVLGWSLREELLTEVLGTVTLPGRGSAHDLRGARVVVDGAISGPGVDAAAAHYLSRPGAVPTALACFPDGKDVEACLAALAGFDVVPVRTAGDHLTFAALQRLAGTPTTVAGALDLAVRRGGCLAVGTQSFVGEVLEAVDAPTDVAYRVG